METRKTLGAKLLETSMPIIEKQEAEKAARLAAQFEKIWPDVEQRLLDEAAKGKRVAYISTASPLGQQLVDIYDQLVARCMAEGIKIQIRSSETYFGW